MRSGLLLSFSVVVVVMALGTREAAAYGTGSCAGTNCTGSSTDCWCDSACSGYGDCCNDYAGTCSAAAFGSRMDAASAADIFVTRSTDEVTQHIIPGFFTHSGTRDYIGGNWIHSTGQVKGGWFDCPLGFFGGTKYEPHPSGNGSGLAASVVFHITNLTTAQRNQAADFAYYHYVGKYPWRGENGHAWSGDTEASWSTNPSYCSSSISEYRSNYDWAWIDTKPNDRAYCSSLVHHTLSSSTVNHCGTNRASGGAWKPLYNHSAEFGPNCVWLGDHFDGFDGDICDGGGGQEGWDAAGHFLGWVQGTHEPDEGQVDSTCHAGVSNVWAITPSELVENQVDSGYTVGYFAYAYAYQP